MQLAPTSFRFWPFALAVLLVLAAVGGLNYAVDPLWYVHGNQLTGKNFVFNERIGKMNRLKRSAVADYDCLILGSSRVVGLRPSAFEGQHCFNLALAGAEVPEMLAYGRAARELGLHPRTVYFGVDDFNFVLKKETARRSNPVVSSTPNAWHAFFSADVLTFSVMTLLGVSPDKDKYYDEQFEMKSFGGSQHYQPVIGTDHAQLSCNPDKVKPYQSFREAFPGAKLIAYTPPMSPWRQLDGVYLPGVLDCELDAFHAVAEAVDAFWDFGIPTTLTRDATLTTDGAHFSPESNDLVVAQLQGRRNDLAVDVKSLTASAYRAEIRSRLKTFLTEENALQWWRQ